MAETVADVLRKMDEDMTDDEVVLLFHDPRTFLMFVNPPKTHEVEG